MTTELKLLLLEDNPDDAVLIQKLLQRSGMNFTAKVVSDEKEFLKTLDENGFDVVLADNALPQYSSLEALDVIKERNPFIAFILVTGTVSEEFAVNIIQQGADDYILKNNLTRLPAAIGKAIENKKIQKEKKVAEKGMQQMNEELQSLSAHLLNVREEERARIAREIHDELGQQITGLKMDVSWLKKKISEKEIETVVKEKLNEMAALLDDTVHTVRKIASELRPSLLDDIGLVAALDWQSNEFKKRFEISVHFTSQKDELLIDPAIATGLFRIYQETLTNVARHANATKVESSLAIIDNKIVLTIADNGKGFDVSNIKSRKTLGLLGMKERAAIINGSLEIKSEPQKGTTVIVSVPFSKK